MEETDKTKLSTPARLRLIHQLEFRLKQNPKDAEAHYTIGSLLAEEKRLDAAIEHLLKALSLDKKNLDIIGQTAETYRQKRDYINARKYARKLVEAKPRELRYLLGLADILEQCGTPDQALKHYDKALSISPNHIPALEQRAMCLRAMGRMQEADEAYARIRLIDPNHPHALYLETTTHKYTAEEAPAMDANIREALKLTDDSIDKANLNYAGGKVWQDAGDHDKAFAYFMAANEERRKERSSDPLNPMRNCMAVFTKAFFNARKHYGHESDRPIFILGMPRSGTTLTESLCGAHSKVTAADEQIYIGRMQDSLGSELREPDKFRERLEGMQPGDVLDFAERYLGYLKPLAGNTPHFTDKMPHNFDRMGLIRLMFPNAKIIHVRRHPVDNCVSLYTNSMTAFHNAYKSDLTMLGLYYRQYLRLMEHWRKVLPGGFHEVYYEDMVANTELNARKMIDYLGLEWEDGVMDRQGSQKTVRTLSVWQVRQPVYTSSAGRWRVYEKHLGPLLDALGPVVEEYEAELAALNRESA